MHQPTNSTLPQAPLESATHISYIVRIFSRMMGMYNVTLTFDPLTLNICSVSAVTRANFVPNFSEIEQSAAE